MFDSAGLPSTQVLPRAPWFSRFARYLFFRTVRRLGWSYLGISPNGCEMVVDLQTPGISAELIVEQTREPEHVVLVQELLKEGEVCLDIGANIGFYTLLMSRIVGPNGFVYCFEPDRRNYTVLEANIQLNGFSDRVSVSRAAIGKESGVGFFEDSGPSNLNRLIPLKSIAPDNPVSSQVEVMTLDDVGKIIGPVDFIRMDVEGSEVEILGPSGGRFLASLREGTRIFLEIHPHLYSGSRDFGTVIRDLWKLGYSQATVISAGRSPDSFFSENGMVPDRIFRFGPTRRAQYRVSDVEVLSRICVRHPKTARYLILQKQR